MYVKPCRRCTLNDSCERRHPLASQLHGLGVRSALIACDVYVDLFQIGDMVEIQLYQELPYGESTAMQLEPTEAVVVDIRQDKFWTWPLDGHTKSIFVTRYADQITKLNEPTIEVCPECHKPKHIKRAEWLCDTCGISYASLVTTGMGDFSWI